MPSLHMALRVTLAWLACLVVDVDDLDGQRLREPEPLDLAVEMAPPERQLESVRKVEARIAGLAAHEGRDLLRAVLLEDSTNSYAWFALGSFEERHGRFTEAAQAYRRAADFVPFAVWGLHHAAAMHTRAGQLDAALRRLKEARERGYTDLGELLIDPDFETLREDRRYLAFLEELANAPRPRNERRSSWSPDGSRLVVSASPEGSGSWDLFVMDADGSNRHSITHSDHHDLQPAWSPDGAWIVFSRVSAWRGSQDLYLVRPDGSELVTLAVPGAMPHGNKAFPTWSPDSEAIAFSLSGGVGESGLYILDLDREEATRIAEAGVAPSFFDDGDRILYEADDGLHVVSRSTARDDLVVSHPGWTYWAPSLSPDERFVAVSAFPRGSRLNQLAVLDLEGGSRRVVTPPKFDAFTPLWSNDGRFFVFHLSPNAFGHGGRTLYRIDVEGTGLAPLKPR